MIAEYILKQIREVIRNIGVDGFAITSKRTATSKYRTKSIFAAANAAHVSLKRDERKQKLGIHTKAELRISALQNVLHECEIK